jgi:hypothetical protein
MVVPWWSEECEKGRVEEGGDGFCRPFPKNVGGPAQLLPSRARQEALGEHQRCFPLPDGRGLAYGAARLRF